MQLEAMAAMGVIFFATDAGWDEKRVQIGLKPTMVGDPCKEK